ncbi:MAG: SDR family NAD(P)-dependent oxidoreductase, partial [Thaumarchaeota archaeon]
MLKDKVAVVTGSSRGIGFEIAKEFAGRGATVVVCSRSMAGAEKSARMIKG